ncbi:MAG: protein kinase, partial [Verrucomicrobia bacterium]|nr:protein kinase [Verrucomicrobiota bacterium]
MVEKPVCGICGASIPVDVDFCPVCALRGALQFNEPPTELLVGRTSELRFGHYQVLTQEDGTPFELGRGAMGVTYKAFDVDLRRLAALKVISPRHLSDESVQQRFLREARAAASVRHPNVASVYHLGTSNEHYFYAMEFVEGETLGNLINRSGRLEAKLAIEIVRQVATGLDAVHKANLVHRDIKPNNIMVNLRDDGVPAVKIIDLGLAKILSESESEIAVSLTGAFVGTPQFASPEQFSGGEVDIRSDLYSLGITLWQMLAGRPPFRGSLNEVMDHHRQTPLPLDKLKDVPEPAGVLTQVLLRKEPARRFQDPAELLAAVATVQESLDSGHHIFQTIRVSVSTGSDVQKEKNLAERVLRSVTAEFGLPVSNASSSCPRLAEADALFADAQFNIDRESREEFVVCLYFWERDVESPNPAAQIPEAAEFDLVISIVWSRLGGRVRWQLPNGTAPVSVTEYEIRWAMHHAAHSGVPQLRVYRSAAKPVPPLEPKEAREEFGRQWDAVQEFFTNWETPVGLSADRSIGVEFSQYRNLEEFEDFLREHFRDFLNGQFEHEQNAKKFSSKAHRWKLSPFRGLNAFDFEHAPIFYGRTRAVGEVFEALEEQRRGQRPFVLVLGASGSGKSSLVRAGILPLLTQPGTIEGIGLWRRAATRPAAGGSDGDCFDALAAALLEKNALPGLANPESANAVADLAAELRDHPGAVALRVRDALDHAAREWKLERSLALRKNNRERTRIEPNEIGAGQSVQALRDRQQNEPELPRIRLALVIDQLEELFTSGFSEDIRRKYVSAIAGLVQSGRVFVLAALRSDFYSSYQEFPKLIELTRPSGKVDLRPPTAYEIGNMIRLPAEAAGLKFERDRVTGQRLDEALRDAAANTPESLPLLEHVLSLLYDKQAGRGDDLLRWSDYRDLGELKGALARYAENVFSTLQPSEQLAFPLVMRHLVTLGQGEDEVPNRRTVPYRDFLAEGSADGNEKPDAKAFVDLFIEKRLLVADTDPQGEVTVSVAHEALLREWSRVREWLAENREFLRMRDRLDASLKLWLSRGKQKDDLLGPGLPLAEGEKLLTDFGSSLSTTQADYINTSMAEQKRRQRIRERIRYGVTAAITAALVVAIIFGFVSYRQYQRAEKQKVAANRAAKRATIARSEAENLINFMMTDLREKVEPIGRLDLLDDVNSRVKRYYDTMARSDDGAEIQRQHSLALVNYGNVLFDRGAKSDAAKLYQEALAITQKLAGQNGRDPNFRADLAAIYQQIGNVLESQGNIDGAFKNYEESRRLREELVEGSPQNSDWQRRLAWSLQKAGLMRETRGDLTGAQKNFVRALSIASKLHGLDPKNLEIRDTLWILNIRAGEVLDEKGEPDGALKYYRDSLEIAQELKRDIPNDTNWQRYVGISREELGNILMTEGDLSGAQREFAAAFSIRSALFAQDQTNGLWENDLALSYEDFAGIANTRGDFEKALKMYQECLFHRNHLVSRDATDLEAQHDFAISKNKFGLVLLANGQFSTALECCTEALQTAQMTAEKDEKNEEWQ